VPGPDTASTGDTARNALSAPLRALDGRTLGSVQLFNRRGGEFADIDQAVLTHLAELAAAALERTQLYVKTTSTARKDES
jgi:GAF domain-containing protein